MKNRMSKNVFCLALIGFGIVSAGNAMASKVRIGGQLQLQAEKHFDDADDRIGGRFRRIELVVKGSVNDNWSYQIDFEKVGDVSVNVSDTATPINRDVSIGNGLLGGMGDSFIAYSGFEPLWIAGGHLSQPFGLENWGSSSSTTFVERNRTIFGQVGDYMTGVYVGGNTDTISYALSLGKSDRDSTDGGEYGGSNAFELAKGHFNYTGRVAWSPKFGDGTAMDGVYHLSASYIGFKADCSHDNGGNCASNPQEDFSIWNISAAGIWGPIMAQAEYEKGNDFNYTANNDPTAYYAQLSYVITGESRSYDVPSATIGRLTPASKNGAWEAAVGYNVYDTDVAGAQKEKTWNVGVNWYWNKYIKMAATYQLRDDTAGDDDNVLYLRTQLRF